MTLYAILYDGIAMLQEKLPVLILFRSPARYTPMLVQHLYHMSLLPSTFRPNNHASQDISTSGAQLNGLCISSPSR